MHRRLRPYRERLPRPRPEDWGLFMTVCIAGVSQPDKVIVFVSDTLLSDDVSSAEGGRKFNPVGGTDRWLAMYAGDPTARQRVVNERLAGFVDKQPRKDEQSQDMAAAFEGAFAEVLREKAERRVLGRYGLDMQSFLNRDPDRFGEKQFARLLKKIEKVKLKTDFLVAGWETENNKPTLFRMFSVHDPGVTVYHDPIGFGVIGSGATQADGYLCGAYDRDLLAPQLIYRLCEAKFRAESAPTVGRRTVVSMLYRDAKEVVENGEKHQRRHFSFPMDRIETFRREWEKERRRFPGKAIAAAADGIDHQQPLPW